MKDTLRTTFLICASLLCISFVILLGGSIIDASAKANTMPTPTQIETPPRTDKIPPSDIKTPNTTPISTPTPTLSPYNRYEEAIKNLKEQDNYEIDGIINIKTALEGIEITFPVQFNLKVINAHDHENYIMQLNYSTSILGISSIVSVYYEDGISYVSTTSIYGEKSYTTKVKSEEEIISSNGGISIDNIHIFGELSEDEFSKIVLSEAESFIIYSLTLTGEEAKKYLEKHLPESVIPPKSTPPLPPADNNNNDIDNNENTGNDKNNIPDNDKNDNIIDIFDKSEIENIQILFAIDFENNFTEFNINFECVYQNELFNKMKAQIKVHVVNILTGDSILITPPDDIDEYI